MPRRRISVASVSSGPSRMVSSELSTNAATLFPAWPSDPAVGLLQVETNLVDAADARMEVSRMVQMIRRPSFILIPLIPAALYSEGLLVLNGCERCGGGRHPATARRPAAYEERPGHRQARAYGFRQRARGLQLQPAGCCSQAWTIANEAGPGVLGPGGTTRRAAREA